MPIDDFLAMSQQPPVSGADLGVPDLPPPPQAPMAPQSRSGGMLSMIAQALPGILGGAMGPGAGTGLLQGYVSGQRFNEAQEQQRFRDAQDQFQIEQSAYNQQAQAQAAMQRQRETILQQNLTGLREAAAKAPDKAAYDGLVEAYANGLRMMGFNPQRIDANFLRKSVPYAAPSAEKKAWEVLERWQKLPNNKELLEKHPEQAANAMIPFDRDGDGEPEMVRLQDLSILAGAPLAMSEQGQVFSNPGTPLAVKANADGILQQLIEKAKAEGKQITPELTIELQKQALKMAEEATAKPKGAGGMTPGQEITNTLKLQKEVERVVAPIREVKMQLNRMREGVAAARERGDLNFGSQVVINTFNRIVEPGSVTRESEYARTPQGIALIGRLEGIVTRFAKGGPGIRIEDLDAAVRLAEELATSMATDLPKRLKKYERTASEFGLDPSLIMPEPDEFSMTPRTTDHAASAREKLRNR